MLKCDVIAMYKHMVKKPSLFQFCFGESRQSTKIAIDSTDSAFAPKKNFFFFAKGKKKRRHRGYTNRTAHRSRKLVKTRLPARFTILLSRFLDYLRKWNSL